MSKRPTVSVILPVYNAEKYLKYALDSILDQSFKDFELILLNDGSTDKSVEIINTYAASDDRIIPIHQENMGLVATLNKGIGIAKGKYIARMDADDISLPRRFETQVRLLDKNPNAVLCATNFDIINEYNEFLKLGVAPGFNEDIKRSMRLYNPIAHGSVMFKKSAFIDAGEYSSKVGPTEDYDLWIRLAELGEFTFSERSLFRWRINPEGITHSRNDVMRDATRKLVDNYRKTHPVTPYTPSQMRTLGRKYIDTFGGIGVTMKEVVLEDTYHIGIKALKEGSPLTGLRHILSVTFTGRTGLKITLERTVEYSLQKIRTLFNK